MQVSEICMAPEHVHQCTSRLLEGHVTSGSVPPHLEHTRGGSRGDEVTSPHVEQGRYDVEQKTPEDHTERRIDRGQFGTEDHNS
ncbi:hypothetical protein AXF42_Ash018663 [Apostasia shenzhenica]|uniref:Uncharacterized protein n=1 Tax=Apostasia shenzhenica TaxID=1088818 RepID=A0A2I0B1M8_9ASPA|nr:hypothetical protein AXF42_Ash018663 [Apostasia shenzhenica]